MPLTESQPDALAETYARSLFELAEAKGGQTLVEEILGELEDLLELAREMPDFNEFLASQVLAVAHRGQSLKRILDGRADPLTLNFLLLLNRKGRLSHLHPIVAALDSIVQERYGRVEVDVYTAAPISPDELSDIRDRLQRALAKEVVAHPYTDASMIGGIKVRVGDRLVDASLATQIRRVRDQLETSGRSRIRSAAGRIILADGQDEE
jgi:F-type H+-transporting ATPase subunit delta